MYIKNKIQAIFLILIGLILIGCTNHNSSSTIQSNSNLKTPKLLSITLTSKREIIPNGSSTNLIAQGKFDNNTERNITNDVKWTISNDKVLNISNKGQILATKQGVVGISASSNGITSNITPIIVTDIISQQ